MIERTQQHVHLHRSGHRTGRLARIVARVPEAGARQHQAAAGARLGFLRFQVDAAAHRVEVDDVAVVEPAAEMDIPSVSLRLIIVRFLQLPTEAQVDVSSRRVAPPGNGIFPG